MSFGQYFITWLSICSREVQVTTKTCVSCSEVVDEHGSRISVVIIVVKYLKNTQPRDYFVWKQNVVQSRSRVTLRFIAKWQRQCVHCCQPGHATPRHATPRHATALHCNALTLVTGWRTKERLEQNVSIWIVLEFLTVGHKSVNCLMYDFARTLDFITEENLRSL
jgi:hypothetical protein